MADNVLVTAGAGTIIAADDINVGSPDLGPIYAQRVKVIWGPDGTGNDTDVASGKPLPVQLRTSAGTAMSFNTGTMDSGTQRVAIASDSPGVISTGTAGSASATVLTVQGVASMTALAVTLPSAQATLSVAQDTSLVTNGATGTTLTPKFIKITASSSGVNVVLAGVSSKKIRVLAGKMVANAAVNAKWQSQTASPDVQTDLTGLSYFGAQGDGEVLGYNPVGWFQTGTGEGLTLNLSSGVAVGGHLTYVEV